MQPGEKYPAFLFYPLDFFNDENVILMDNRHIGCYMRLLGHQWIEHSIPDALPKIAKICKEDASAMAELWLAIEPCFQPHPTLPGRLFNHRLEEERAKLELKRHERSESGSRGARARWDKGSGPMGPPKLSDSSAIAQPLAQPIANDGIPIPMPIPNQEDKTMPTGSTGSGEPERSAPPSAAKEKRVRAPTPKPEPKFGEGGRRMATMIYDYLKSSGALPPGDRFFPAQAVKGEKMLGDHSFEEWQGAFEWAKADPWHAPRMTNLAYLADVVWSKYSLAKGAPPSTKGADQHRSPGSPGMAGPTYDPEAILGHK